AQGVLSPRKEIAGVEVPIAYKFEEVTVELIGPRFGNHVYHRARMQPVAGRDAAGLHAEFLEGVWKREWQVHICMRIVMVPTIQQVVVAVDLASGDGDANGADVIMGAGCPSARRQGRAAG